MPTETDPSPMTELDVLVGVWQMHATFHAADAPAEARFEWLPGRQFLVQRWQVEHPDAPDGIAIIGYDADRATYLQHYFDSRGVARVYEMTMAGGVWTLSRTGSDFSQRFTGIFSEDAQTIAGTWEISSDASHWVHDFDLSYVRSSA